MTKMAASSITIDDSKLRMDALLNRFMKSSVFVFSIVNVDVTVLVVVVAMVSVKFSCLTCVNVIAFGTV